MSEINNVEQNLESTETNHSAEQLRLQRNDTEEMGESLDSENLSMEDPLVSETNDSSSEELSENTESKDIGQELDEISFSEDKNIVVESNGGYDATDVVDGGENQVSSINGVMIVEGKVDGKIPIEDYEEIMSNSVHNSDSEILTLGKYEPSIREDGSKDYSHPADTSYNVVAEKNGDMYFDMKNGLYEQTIEKYDLSHQDMFYDFNAPVLEQAANEDKTIRFTVDPESNDRKGTFTEQEWNYLQEKCGYIYLREEGGFYYAEK